MADETKSNAADSSAAIAPAASAETSLESSSSGWFGWWPSTASAKTAAAQPAVLLGWDEAALAAQLAAHQYGEVMATVTTFMETRRDPRAVDWAIRTGYKEHCVPVLYKLVRNFLKWQDRGRVQSIQDMNFGLRAAVVLLIRVAQDVESCRMDLAKHDLGSIYTAFRSKIWSWLKVYEPALLPSRVKVLHDVEVWSRGATQLPSPVWATAFTVSRVSFATFTWGTPTAVDISAFERSMTVQATRMAVCESFIAFAKRQTCWSALFTAELSDIVATVP